ncbi:ParA family protein [Nostoc sp.]
MTIIALVNQKGGCSKSTSAVHLTCWLSRKGRKVHLLDADAQRSSSIWLQSIEENSIPTTNCAAITRRTLRANPRVSSAI